VQSPKQIAFGQPTYLTRAQLTWGSSGKLMLEGVLYWILGNMNEWSVLNFNSTAALSFLLLQKEGYTYQGKGKQGSVVHAEDLNACYVEVRRMLKRGPLDLEFEVRMECVEFLETQCELPNNRTCIWWAGEWRVLWVVVSLENSPWRQMKWNPNVRSFLLGQIERSLRCSRLLPNS